MTSILAEGGVAGHMNHLYDNPDLTFREMKQIFQAASNGELKGTEKTDGQNLQLSYDISTGTARAARNKGNIKAGGMDAAALASKFGGRGALETAFTEAFAAFEDAVGRMSIEEREEIFGPDVNVYYNAEVQDPRAANLINYDVPTLTIHRVGHNEYDRGTGAATGRDVSKNARKLAKALERVQGDREEGKFRVEMNAIRRLEALGNDTAANLAIARLEKATSDQGISDNQTVGEYTVSRVEQMIDSRILLPDLVKKELMKRIFKEKGANIRNVLKLVDKGDGATTAAIRELVADAGKLKQRAVAPIEEIVHDFSVEMLKGLHSAFILDNEAEVERLRAETQRAITAIESSNSEEAMEILAKQMNKLKSAEGVSTAAEGFVFDYDGVTYKFTGNFAPMNQLLGLFKYGRGNVPPLQKLDEEEIEITDLQKPNNKEVGRKIAVFPGAFKPPHRGHMNVVEALLQKGVDQVVVLVSRLDRKTPAGRPVDRNVSERIWQIYIDSKGLGDRVYIGESEWNAPVTTAYEVLKGTVPDLIPQPGDLIIPAASDKPDKYGKPDYDRFKNFHKGIKGMIDGVIPANIMEWYYEAPKEAPMSASAFRAALDTGEGLEAFLPTDVDPDDVLDVLGVKRDEVPLDEMSSMAGGSVAGYSGTPARSRTDEVVEEVLNYLISKGVLR